MGSSLNILSMMGLMLAVGMLVDNAIVVLESIDRRMREEGDRRKAALQGAGQVLMAVTASTATTLIVFGALLWWADRASAATRPLSEMTWRHALLIGFAQAIALVPGVSRSGATMTAARFLSFDRQSAAVFSFLMSMPVITAAAVLKVPKLLADGIDSTVIVGIAFAAVSSWLAIAVLLRFIKRYGFATFAVYRFVLGAAIYALVFYRG